VAGDSQGKKFTCEFHNMKPLLLQLIPNSPCLLLVFFYAGVQNDWNALDFRDRYSFMPANLCGLLQLTEKSWCDHYYKASFPQIYLELSRVHHSTLCRASPFLV